VSEPHLEHNVIMDRGQESRKTRHLTDQCTPCYTEDCSTFEKSKSSLSNAVTFMDAKIPEFEFTGPPAHSALDSRRAFSIHDEFASNNSTPSPWLWSLDAGSTVGSLSHGSSPSNSSSSLDGTPLTEFNLGECEVFNYPMQQISHGFKAWKSMSIPENQILIKQQLDYNDTWDFTRCISDGMPDINLTDPLEAMTVEAKRMEHTDSISLVPSTNIQFLDLQESSNGSTTQFQTLGSSCDSKTSRPKHQRRRRRTPAQSKHLERWLEAHSTVPGKEIQNLLASQSGLSISQVKYWFKNALKEKATGASLKAGFMKEASCPSTGTREKECKSLNSNNLQLVVGGENFSRGMTESDSDDSDYSEDKSPEPIPGAPAHINIYQKQQSSAAIRNVAPNSTCDYSAFMEGIIAHQSSSQSNASPSATSSVPSPESDGNDKTSNESSPNSSMAESPGETNYSGSTSGSDASTPNTISERVGFEARKRAVVDRLLAMFLPLFTSLFLWSARRHSRQGKGGCQDQEAGETGSKNRATQRGNGDSNERKRGRQIANSENNDEHINKDATPSKKAKTSGTNDLADSPLYACPYFKRNRQKYQRWRGCPGPGWDSIHRVK
jgi:hypothetical protein